MTDLVIMKDRQAVTTSLNLAESFEKEHKNVIQVIESKIQSAENSAHYKKMFALGSYVDSRGREQKMYYMNRDGWTFIAVGFTGRKADSFKLKYIEAFNQMENHIKSGQSKQIDSDLEEIKRMNATARVMNATSRQAKMYMDMAKDATTEVNKALLQDKMEQALSGYHQLEWEIFLLQLDNELHEVKYIGTSQTEISTEIESKGKMVPLVIKKVNNRIIKRQSGGNQPLLMGVNQFVCQEKNNGVDFVVTFTDGKKKEGTWIFE
ncbi:MULTISPECIES: competence type IV pilus minor pilin ComGF [Enterococcus]|uniref:competence type IV pilus minor pilin ComGF n=1 Tax=Enterococcus TaxID=1350 RepID=UPI0022E3FE82|nr:MULTISPECIES: competence type IV pilus minor pilin ComGF [Enterococcus]